MDKDTDMDKATSEGVGIDGIKKDVDDEWMRMMRRRVEARAAAAAMSKQSEAVAAAKKKYSAR